MKPGLRSLALVSFSLGSSLALADLTPDQTVKLPPPADHKIDFVTEIKPILETGCVKCHGRGKAKGEFSIENREALLKGGESGPAVVSGNSAKSHLIELVSGLDPDNVMPKKGSKLKPEQVGLLRAWIDQGVRWDKSISFAKPAPVNLYPHTPALPRSGRKNTNPVDALLQPYYVAHNIKPAALVNDRIYARRVYLDIIGLLPPPEELTAFMADRSADKRSRLVQRLLADNRRYAEHWLTFWNDALRNDYQGTGYIDGGRKQITGWLYSALATNMPFNQFVRELVNPTAESEGFARGIVWRGVVNASQTPQMQAAQNISQVFLGVNLKCASCHDSFINDWQLSDSYGLAGIYSDAPLEMVQCDKPTGKVAPVHFLYPELGSIDSKAPKSERLKQLADVMTSDRNGRVTRTIVNRIWAKFMGRGLVEPVDDMEQRAWNQDLLDWLAADLAASGYNLKRTMALILTSRAYQLPAMPAGERTAKDFVFRGPQTRRMSAEQYLDALSSVTGVWNEMPAAQVDVSAAEPRLGEPVAAPKWIWSQSGAAERAQPGTVRFRKVVDLSRIPESAMVAITCDNSFKLFVNGHEVGSGKDHGQFHLIDVHDRLRQGRNVFAIEATNDKARPDDPNADQANPAGVILYARLRSGPLADGSGGVVMDFVSDKSWAFSAGMSEGWEKPEFDETGWEKATELGDVGMAPWKLEAPFSRALATAAVCGNVRSSLMNNDPLMTALSRPNREQVITTRTSAATTLQALELTNGATLAGLLRRGAEKLIQESPASGHALVIELFDRGLGRKPSDQEAQLSEQLLGTPANQQGVEDLLWAISMLPEFQLIY